MHDNNAKTCDLYAIFNIPYFNKTKIGRTKIVISSEINRSNLKCEIIMLYYLI